MTISGVLMVILKAGKIEFTLTIECSLATDKEQLFVLRMFYSRNQNLRLVRHSNGWKQSGSWMVRYFNGIWWRKLIKNVESGLVIKCSVVKPRFKYWTELVWKLHKDRRFGQFQTLFAIRILDRKRSGIWKFPIFRCAEFGSTLQSRDLNYGLARYLNGHKQSECQ